ncbi:GNAT family N-acetyltransferase [Kordiimonas marina]|uniref:GNAT family N-acetyltransferase n=1 Tax=Kordiimonas marina TaxID=2872312 RepID=UPI001FF29838|nr:GNAT family N-acetyltransferase [Kordiimonas marina]MCJ9428269.1 GNAT family N-acetyltransferase [Kordiimonas marina]
MPTARPKQPEGSRLAGRGTVSLVPYAPVHRQAFHDLNLAWLEKYFTVEPVHLKVLRDPEGEIIAKGGEIFFALLDGKPVGTVAVRADGGGAYELTKLGVDPAAQGYGIGRKLCQAVIDWYKAQPDGVRLFLETHTKLKPAMHLYEALDFRLTKNPGADEYEGTDCYMEWRPS